MLKEFRDNIISILGRMDAMGGVMRQMPVLPVRAKPQSACYVCLSCTLALAARSSTWFSSPDRFLSFPVPELASAVLKASSAAVVHQDAPLLKLIL